MSFKALILYDLVRYLVREEDVFLVRFNSLCRSFSVDVPSLLARFSTPRYARLIARALNCRQYTNELELSLPADALRELITLKLWRLSKFVRKDARLRDDMHGAACVTDGHVYMCHTNEAFRDYIMEEYSPLDYSYSDDSELAIVSRAKVFFCGYGEIPFFACAAARVVSNTRARVRLTDACLDALLSEQNAALLESVFMRGSGTPINLALRYLYYFLRGGHTPNGACSIDLFN